MSNPNPRPGQLANGILLLVISGLMLIAMLSTCHHSSTPATSGTSSTTPAPVTPTNRLGADDVTYLRILKGHVFGITNTEGDAGLIKMGHAICDELKLGSISRQGHGRSDSDASWLITASVAAYCPDYVLPSDRW